MIKQDTLLRRIECPLCRTNYILNNNEFLQKNRLLVALLEKETLPNNLKNAEESKKVTIIPVKYEESYEKESTDKYLESIFNEVDLNKDGQIGLLELEEALKKGELDNFKLKQETIKELIQKYDKEKSGEISFNEFIHLHNHLNEEYGNFIDLDTNNNGTVEFVEFLNQVKINYSIELSLNLLKKLQFIIYSRDILNFDDYLKLNTLINNLHSMYLSNPANLQFSFVHFCENNISSSNL